MGRESFASTFDVVAITSRLQEENDVIGEYGINVTCTYMQ